MYTQMYNCILMNTWGQPRECYVWYCVLVFFFNSNIDFIFVVDLRRHVSRMGWYVLVCAGTSRVTRVNASCHTCVSVTWFVGMSHACAYHDTHESPMSHMWMRHITQKSLAPHMCESHESCHTHRWVKSHIWLRYVTHGWVVSHISLARAGSLSNAILAPSSPLLISCALSLPISHSFCLPALVVSRSLPHFSFPSPSPRLFTLDLAHVLALSLSLSPLHALALPHLPSLPCINRGCCMIVAPLRSSVTPCIETACAWERLWEM